MCPMCSDNRPTLLGFLGTRAHYRCRACGWTYSPELDLFDTDSDAPYWAEQD